jgi:hypothetical protein
LSTHRKPRSRKIIGASVALLALVAGGITASAASATTSGAGYVEIYQACEGAAELSIVAHNLVDGTTVNFAVDGTAANTAVAMTLSDVVFGIRTSGIPMKTGDTYNLTATGPGGYSANFAGTYDCSGTAPISATPVAPVVTDQVITCTADYTLQTVSASIAIPATEGIDYSIDGKVVTGTVLVTPGTYLVAAAAKSGYVLTTPYNVYVGVNAGVAPVCEKPPVVTPPVETPPVVTPPAVTVPVTTPAVVAAPVVAKAKVTEAVPKVVQTD